MRTKHLGLEHGVYAMCMDRFQLEAGLIMAWARLQRHARPGWVTGRAVLGLPDTHVPLDMAVDTRLL